jgi:3-oxochol-4-en-24-oyl-CoA dehydrogenase
VPDEEDELPIATTDEQLALQASIREWAKRVGAIELVRDADPGGDPQTPASPSPSAGPGPGANRSGDGSQLWAELADLGIFSIAVPAQAGGAGGTTGDLAAAVAQLADSLVPGPVLPTLLAGLVLARDADRPAARTVLPQLAVGRAAIATMLDAAFEGERAAGGGLRVHGATGPVLGAGSSSYLLLGASGGTGANDAWCLVPAGDPGITISERSPADFSRSVADIRLDVLVPPEQILAGVTTGLVRDLAATLFAAEAAAVAGWCSATAAGYAAIRHQFGRPIGSFQAVKHLCAGMACQAETASVLAWDAARAADQAPGELPLVAAAAAGFSLDAAVDNAKDCIQVLGGVGFTWDHDAHLYLRRALALRQLLGGSAVWRRRAGELAMAGRRRSLTLSAASSDSAELQVTRLTAREFARTTAALPVSARRPAMADSGYAAPSWPAPYGLGASAAELLVIDDELAAAGLARPDIGIGGWALDAILRHGDDSQRTRFAGPTLRGEISWCQLFSEPEAGSDLASLRTRAEPADGGWLITGQKVWTSLARQADWAICLARTELRAPKHKGISFFLVPMTSPGIDVRPLREMTGRRMFNQVFLDQVFVPDDCLVGTPGEGWRIARSTLASERVAIGAGSSVGEAVEAVLKLAVPAGGASSNDVLGGQRATEQIGGLVAQGLAVSLLDLQAALAQLRGSDPGSLAAVRKLVGVAHRQEAAETAFELTGPSGAVADGEHAAVLEEFLLSRCLSIAGGTTQILLSLVAERLLGLPREEAR